MGHDEKVVPVILTFKKSNLINLIFESMLSSAAFEEFLSFSSYNQKTRTEL